jgi:hypothetical protein
MTMATIAVMDIATLKHVRFQPSRDLWKVEVHDRGNFANGITFQDV